MRNVWFIWPIALFVGPAIWAAGASNRRGLRAIVAMEVVAVVALVTLCWLNTPMPRDLLAQSGELGLALMFAGLLTGFSLTGVGIGWYVWRR